ncbi:Protein IMPACT [Auxenochlorella protothecoides]|uniref:Protein IMPACT n=1 Tax=Auxenochlorella protothecoides TaxID=3075 RepID=A0A087SFT9_AUXPR|nr:Protein IMPACT [Auxenochlorella protothecoides]KFM24593.1 Protein IMPACT [Auxenochlorella protothecoides]RMZ53142.1 hypothetical protein APUTEX25_005131 [Auxenochlorella protothecoides]|eukprot:RMZ53142.1 hypothetical protein APUTEX25_005131 [Auxenochlorella protothecoides]
MGGLLEDVQEELCAISAIYGDDAVDVDLDSGICTVRLSSGSASLTAGVLLPADYPAVSPPHLEVASTGMDDAVLDDCIAGLVESFSPGEPVIFQWLEALRMCMEDWVADQPPPSPGEGGDEATEASDDAKPGGELPSQAHPEASPGPDLGIAYRFQMGNGTWAMDSDDDGESAAGGRLLHLLQITGAQDVCVVVSRWYGGIQLGPARFTHINNAARQLLVQCDMLEGRNTKSKGPRSHA